MDYYVEKIAIVIEAAIRISLIAHSFLLHHEFSLLSWYSSHSLCYLEMSRQKPQISCLSYT